MRKLNALFIALMVTLCCAALIAQQAPPAGGPGGGRGPGGPGGGGQGRGRGGPAPAPPATGPVADATNRIVDAINKQDTAALTKALAADAIIADEDGHVGIPASAWVPRVTNVTAGPKKLAITGLRVGDLGAEGAWAVFSYIFDETARGAANQMKGTCSIVFKKSGADIQAALFHFSVDGPAIQTH